MVEFNKTGILVFEPCNCGLVSRRSVSGCYCGCGDQVVRKLSLTKEEQKKVLESELEEIEVEKKEIEKKLKEL